MRALTTAVSCWGWLLVVGPAYTSDWPTYKHDYHRIGRTTDELRPPLTLRWMYEAPQAPRRAWPGPDGRTIEDLHLRHRVRFDEVFQTAVVDGKVYFGSSVDNHVYCFQANTGQLIWSFPTGAPVRLTPTVVHGKVFVGSDDGFVYCLDAGTGMPAWKLRAGPRDERILARGRMSSRWPVRTGVLVDDGVAYFGAGTFPHENVYLSAVHANTAEILWKNDTISQRDAGRNDLTPQGYLLASDTTLFVPSGRSLPAAFDRRTGQLAHKRIAAERQTGGSEALLTDDKIYSVGEH